MADSQNTGCEKCRMGFYSHEMPPPRRLAPHPKWPTELLYCDICGTYWEADAHHPTVVTEEYARKEYPNAF